MLLVKRFDPLCVTALMLVALTCIVTATDAQNTDFDSDSIYYTPLSRTPPATVERSVSVFRDTAKVGQFTRYYFDVGMAMLAGCSCGTGPEFTSSTSTIHGVTLGRKLRVGAGVGFDTYVGWLAAPMFGSVGYDLVGTRNTHALFVQGQYGFSFAWFQGYTNALLPDEQHGGPMFAALAGYRLRYHNLRIAISAGFKQQKAITVYETETWMPSETGGMVPGTPSHTTIETTMGRGVLNLAFSWK
ncbi:hypothetical protein WBG78_06860 [Chryseolinea sp. T2]|uniref:hypothetical protein n=1 Tax=Chryseolinea sp. T2 TaxID=3129255 RepID=UPI00307892F4